MREALHDLIMAVQYEVDRHWWQQSYLPLVVVRLKNVVGMLPLSR